MLRDDRGRIRRDKPEAATAWDGLHGAVTSLPVEDASAKAVLKHYHGLRQVEAAVVENPSDRRRCGIPMPLTQDAKKLYRLMQTPYPLEPFLIG